MPIIEIDNLEVPIVDGSGAPFVRRSGKRESRRTAAAAGICAFDVRYRWKPPASASPSCPRTVFCLPATSFSIIRWWAARLSKWK